MIRNATPQKLDSVVRTITTSVLAFLMVGAVLYITIIGQSGERLTGLQAVLVGWAGVVVGFYFGGHVAQNTAALEEARQVRATDASEASAIRSEKAASEKNLKMLKCLHSANGSTRLW